MLGLNETDVNYKVFTEGMVIEKASGSTYGRWMIRLPENIFKFFWKKADAEKFRETYSWTDLNKEYYFRERC